MSARPKDQERERAEHGAPLALRSMTPADIKPVVALERTLFSDPWPEALFRDELRHAPLTHAIVADEGGEIVGYALCTFILDEAHLENLAVAPRRWGGGVAQDLMAGVIAEAARRGARYLALEVRSSNARALRFYERNGFRQVAVRKGYYRRPPEDAIVMFLSLGGAAAD